MINLLIVLPVTGTFTEIAGATGGAVFDSPACTQNSLDANDDGSTGLVDLPFSINFFGSNYTALYVNNNGNVTFNEPQGTYTPYTIDANIPPMIAPFFADVDTRGIGSVTYGTTQYNGFPTFCVNWTGVGYFRQQTDLTNTFQLLLVSRPDIGNGAFDVVFDYGQIQWETGSASHGAEGFGGISAGAGFSNGDGHPNHFYEIPGSLSSGSFLDGHPSSLVNSSLGSTSAGEYYFHIRTASDDSGTISGLSRPFPTNAIGYNFQNRGLNNWQSATGLVTSDVLQQSDLQRTFVDWNSVTQMRVGPTSVSHTSHFVQALAQVMNGGMCFGMALSGGRFDAQLEPMSSGPPYKIDPSSPYRIDNTWYKSQAFNLPAPGTSGASSSYNQQFMRMLANDSATQFSTQVISSRQLQSDAFSDVTNGFIAFKNQIVSVMRHGTNLYDPSGLTNTADGNVFAGITIDEPGFGHEVLAYSLQQSSNGTLTIGVWDNNFPNTALAITVHPDGSWSYNADYHGDGHFPNQTLTFENNGSHPLAHLEILPLYQPSGLNYFPQGPGSSASLSSGAFVDLPAGATTSATDASGRPVDTLAIASSGHDAGSILVLPSGIADVSVSNGGLFDIRGHGVFMDVSSSQRSVSVHFDSPQGAASLNHGTGDLEVIRGQISATTRGARGLQITRTGGVAVTGSGQQTTATVTGTVGTTQVTTTVYSGSLGRGSSVSFTAKQLRAALITASKNNGSKNNGLTTTLLLVAGLIVVIVVIAVSVWWFLRRRRPGPTARAFCDNCGSPTDSKVLFCGKCGHAR